ncbi:MAG: family 20 glycosylhydrolase [Opitutus sp.]
MIRAFQWDLARQVERLDWLLEQLPRYADWGYQELYLHLEDAVEYPSLPTVARSDAYRHDDMLRLVRVASAVGIKTVPIVNLLGHTQYLIKTTELRDLNELRSADGSALEHGQICPLHPATISVAKKLLSDVAPFCTAGKVHLGLDESFHLGKHLRSQREVARIGLAGHFARYVQKLHRLTQAVGLEMGMWGDMFYFLPEAMQQLPRDITVYEWYYHAFQRHPRVELFNFADFDLTTPLRERGVEHFGCPMNGAFRFEPLPHFGDRMGNIVAWWQHCRRTNAKGFLMSSWEPNRLAIELTTAIDAAAAGLWLEGHVRAPEELLARGFERAFGGSGRAAAKAALACDRYPFSGYPRWEINQRWDSLSRREAIGPYQAEAKYFVKLSGSAKQAKLPSALRESIKLRTALAIRDLAVRRLNRLKAAPPSSTAATIGIAAAEKQLRSALHLGRGAARAMWARTRDKTIVSPNEKILMEDLRRLQSFERGEPVFGGPWQLRYAVWNFAPAAQRVGVEQRQADGTWLVIQACHTIEFQTCAAQPRSGIVREHSAPVAWAKGAKPPQLRLFIDGIGQVKIGGIELSSGRLNLPAGGSKSAWRRLGEPAPRRGWPVLGVRHTLELRFSL